MATFRSRDLINATHTLPLLYLLEVRPAGIQCIIRQHAYRTACTCMFYGPRAGLLASFPGLPLVWSTILPGKNRVDRARGRPGNEATGLWLPGNGPGVVYGSLSLQHRNLFISGMYPMYIHISADFIAGPVRSRMMLMEKAHKYGQLLYDKKKHHVHDGHASKHNILS